MKLKDLTTHINSPIFSTHDVANAFPEEPYSQINTQLYRLADRGALIGVKRGMYVLPSSVIDEFVLANKLYTPSYVSLESVLNATGVIPDIAANVTSVTTTTSKKLRTPLGDFLYSKIRKNLYFGYASILDPKSGIYYNIACPEKALLDYIYIRKIKNLSESRVDMSNVDTKVLTAYSCYFPEWVQRVVNNA